MPNVANTLCLAAKAWSDACYLDEIQGPLRERLTMQDRHEVNKKAIEYAKQVGHSTRLTSHQKLVISRTWFSWLFLLCPHKILRTLHTGSL